jgi:hypothetical protein
LFAKIHQVGQLTAYQTPAGSQSSGVFFSGKTRILTAFLAESLGFARIEKRRKIYWGLSFGRNNVIIHGLDDFAREWFKLVASRRDRCSVLD